MTLLQDGLITGGKDGQMRTWRMQRYNSSSKPKLLSTVREHKNKIVALEISKDEIECISASEDGACIIWNISK